MHQLCDPNNKLQLFFFFKYNFVNRRENRSCLAVSHASTATRSEERILHSIECAFEQCVCVHIMKWRVTRANVALSR